MTDKFARTPQWPHRQPWRTIRHQIVLLDPDTRTPTDPANATLDQLDRMWAALHAWEHHPNHIGTLIGDFSRELRETLIETEDTARRTQRLTSEPNAQTQNVAA